MIENSDKSLIYIDRLTKIGIALSAEKNISKLLKMIISGAMDLCCADGGTIYLVANQACLEFSVIANKTLKIKPSLFSELNFKMNSIPLYFDDKPNLKNVASYCFHENQTVNIDDAYDASTAKHFDFSGTRKADEKLGYRSKSFLTIPLKNQDNIIIGVLQLINALDEKTGKYVTFSEDKVKLAESLASQAAITLTKQELIEAQKKLFEALIKLIALAIDEKCTYTSNHCTRIPILTDMIAKAVNKVNTGPLKNFHLSEDEMEELSMAAWMHDCGKLTVPEYIINKAKKLETLTDRIEVVDLRFEVIKRDLKIAFLEKQLEQLDVKNRLRHNSEEEGELQKSINAITLSKEYLHKVNTGGEFLSEQDKEKIRNFAIQYTFMDGALQTPLLSPDDISNLCISKGTLNDKEREVIQSHVRVSQKMLQSLPYPPHLKNVPIIAGGHHERLDGKGYPNHLKGDQISMQARIVAIADIFEALTAADRPYKVAKTLKESLEIMDRMKKDGHIDPDLYDLFVNEKVYLEFAKKYLNPAQIDA